MGTLYLFPQRLRLLGAILRKQIAQMERIRQSVDFSALNCPQACFSTETKRIRGRKLQLCVTSSLTHRNEKIWGNYKPRFGNFQGQERIEICSLLSQEGRNLVCLLMGQLCNRSWVSTSSLVSTLNC